MHTLFEGVLTNETRCLTCETISSRDESFLDLSIDIEQNSSVTACLRQFSASEMLCQKNKFFCEICCGLQEAEKRMKVKKMPNILALHLKRFKYQEQFGRYMKLAYRVVFPLELRLFNTSDDVQDPDRLYQLFAVVIHIGIGPNQGHYVAIVRNQGRWVLCDDENVEPIAETDIPRYFGDLPAGAGYVLFYQAVDLDLTELGLKKPEPAPAAEPVPDLADPKRVGDDIDLGDPLPLPQLKTPQFAPGVELMSDDISPSETITSPKLKVDTALAEDYQNGLDEAGRRMSVTSSVAASSSVSGSANGRPRLNSIGGQQSDTSGTSLSRSTPSIAPTPQHYNAKESSSQSSRTGGGWFSRVLNGADKDNGEDKKSRRSSIVQSNIGHSSETSFDKLGISMTNGTTDSTLSRSQPGLRALSPSSTLSLSAAGGSSDPSRPNGSNSPISPSPIPYRSNGIDSSPSAKTIQKTNSIPSSRANLGKSLDEKDHGNILSRKISSRVPGLKRSSSSAVKNIFSRKSISKTDNGS